VEREGEGKGTGGERGGDVEAPGKWSAPRPALALGGPDNTNYVIGNPVGIRIMCSSKLIIKKALPRPNGVLKETK